jgi:hypothetical protein
MEAEVIVPGRTPQLAADAALAPVLAEQGSRYPPQQPEVLRRRPVLEPAVVLPEERSPEVTIPGPGLYERPYTSGFAK